MMKVYIYLICKLIKFTIENDQYGFLVIFGTAVLFHIFSLHIERMFWL